MRVGNGEAEGCGSKEPADKTGQGSKLRNTRISHRDGEKSGGRGTLFFEELAHRRHLERGRHNLFCKNPVWGQKNGAEIGVGQNTDRTTQRNGDAGGTED